MSQRAHRFTLSAIVFFTAFLALPNIGEAQFGRLTDRLKDAAEDQLASELEDMVRGAVRCVFDDLECIERAEDSGQPVVLTDTDGEILTDDEGRPIMNTEDLPPELAPPPPPNPNYDFEPGTRVLFEADLEGENPGDFPRVLEFVRGNMQVVDWQGQRFLQADDKESRFAVQLPETLPDRFTIEFDAHDANGRTGVGVALTEPTRFDFAWDHYFEEHYFAAGHRQGSGLWAGRGQQISTTATTEVKDGVVPVRIMVDGAHAKMFIGETRVANVPTAQLGRSDKIYFFLDPTPSKLAYVGNIRIAAGGRPLYDALDTDGRVAVHGILFDTDKATIRAESAPVLEEIGTMLTEHADLSLMVEGHTDDEGDFDYNMTLSGERSAAVKAYLVENFGIEASRLRTMGLGPTQPVADNDTPEGMQQNRRVELVKIN